MFYLLNIFYLFKSKNSENQQETNSEMKKELESSSMDLDVSNTSKKSLLL